MTFSVEARQFFDRLLTPPTIARATLYATLIDALVSASVWAKLDALFLFAAADEGTSLINLRSASFQAYLDTGSGFPVFTVDQGWSNGGAVGVRGINYNFNPSTAGGNYTQDNAMFGGQVIGSTAEPRFLLTDSLNNENNELFPQFTDTNTYWSINAVGTGAGENEVANPTGPSGFWLIQRTGSTASSLYRGDVLKDSSILPSAAMVNADFVCNLSANTIAAAQIGSSLTAPQITVLASSVSTFVASV